MNALVSGVLRGHECPRNALSRVYGAVRANEICAGLLAMEHRTARTPASSLKVSKRSGRVYWKRYTAVCVRRGRTLRDLSAPELRGPVAFLLMLLQQVRPGTRRAWTKANWLGVDGPWQKSPPKSYAFRLRRGTRTLAKWLACFRTLGVLKNWQPPASGAPEHARTRRGRTYSCYELQGELPREWLDWQIQRAVAEAKEATEAAAMPTTAPEERVRDDDFAADLAELNSEHEAQGPPSAAELAAHIALIEARLGSKFLE